MRLYIGEFPVTSLYIPGILCTIWLYRFTKKYQNWVIFVIIILLITTLMSTYIHDTYNLNNKDYNMYEYINMPSYWWLNHGKSVLVSDHMTMNFGVLSFSEYSELNSKPYANTISNPKNIKVMTTPDISFLTQKSTALNEKKYYMVNYKLNMLSFNNWMFLKSWTYSKNKIDSNLGINKIYDTNATSIYY
jgi:hypothetical protein